MRRQLHRLSLLIQLFLLEIRSLKSAYIRLYYRLLIDRKLFVRVQTNYQLSQPGIDQILLASRPDILQNVSFCTGLQEQHIFFGLHEFGL